MPLRQIARDIGKAPHLGDSLQLWSGYPLRFTKLQRILDLQPKTLAARLQELVGFGLLSRTSYNEIPPRVDYELTPKGKDLGRLFDELHTWSDKYQDTELPRKARRSSQKRS